MISEIMFIMQRLFILVRSSIELSPVRRICMNNLKVAVFGFSPHAHGAGVFAKKSAFSHLIQRLGPLKEVIA